VNVSNVEVKVRKVQVNEANLSKNLNSNKVNSEVRLVETVNLKPLHSTVVACGVSESFKNENIVFAVGIFPDKVVINDNLMIQSSVINSNHKSILMPIINCSNESIQLKKGTIVAHAQKLVYKNNGALAETTCEKLKREVNVNEYKKSE
ncbi:unnamed protein product, partial [Rotaria magnacalcarata]